MRGSAGALARSLRLCCSSRSFAGTASFGYEEVPEADKQSRVGTVFSNVAPSYDVMNDAMSMGLHRLWKGRMVAQMSLFPGMQHLDVAGGTGDIAFRVAQALLPIEQQAEALHTNLDTGRRPAHITVCDINAEMLDEGRRRAAQGMPGRDLLSWVQGNAEQLPVPSASQDSYSIAFGIRNVTHIDTALEEARRVLKRGGHFLCLEFSPQAVQGLQTIYDWYSFNIIPQMGRLIADDEASYKYLVESIRRFPDHVTFKGMMQRAGFSSVKHIPMSGRIVALYSGVKL